MTMNLAMVVLAFGFAGWTRSNAILLDGFFSLIGVAEVIAMRVVARMQWAPPTASRPFGFGALVPLLNMGRGLLALAVSVYAGVQAIVLIIHGGDHPDAGAGLLYGLLAAAGCFVGGWVVGRGARETGSPLLTVDARTWWFDGFYSVVVALAFLVAMFLLAFDFDTTARYVDSVLVLVLLALAAPWLIGIVRTSLRELLLLAPGEEVRDRAAKAVGEELAVLDPVEIVYRVLHSGGVLSVMCHIRFDPDRTLVIADLDAARARALEALNREFPEVELDVVVTGDPKLGVLAQESSED